MIRLGICSDLKNIATAADIGFDYLEHSLTGIAGMSDEAFSEACTLVDRMPIKVEACNSLLPAQAKIVGGSVNLDAIVSYLSTAFMRAARLGAKVIVFGSGNARQSPEGFPTGNAWRQIADFLKLVNGCAEKYALTVVIEPLCAAECNILHYVSEATLLASLLQLPHIAVLGDTYHMALGAEPLDALRMAGDMLKHVHTANNTTRQFPTPEASQQYTALFDTLKKMNYQGRVSVEGRCDSFAEDAQRALKVLRSAQG